MSFLSICMYSLEKNPFRSLLNHSVMSDSLRPHGLLHVKLPCPSLYPGVGPNSFPVSLWCHPTTSSSVSLFSSCSQSFPVSGSFPHESALCIRWPEYWSFSFSNSLSNEYSGLISFRTNLISSLSKGLSGVSSGTTVWKHQFFNVHLALWSSYHVDRWLLEKP